MTGMVATVYGRLGKEPRPVETQTGKAMAVASLACDTSHAKNPDSTTWVGLVAFGRNAELLLACDVGHTISATGRVQATRWTHEGKTVEQLQVVVDSLHGPRTVRARLPAQEPADEPAGSRSVTASKPSRTARKFKRLDYLDG